METDNKINRVLSMCPMAKVAPIIRPVNEKCNLKCTYCYYNESNQLYTTKDVLSLDILESFIKQYFDIYEGNVVFMWHGGEPMLAGLDFFKRAVELQQKHKKTCHRVENNIQTNGTLINSEWVRFFKENNFFVGLSLDGVQECHDHFRKTSKGLGTYKMVVDAIETLRKDNIEPGILQTLTRFSIPYISQNFAHFVDDLKIKKWGINVFNNTDENPLMTNEVLSNEEYYEAYKNYYVLWKERNDPSIEIRDIFVAICSVMGRYTGICQTSGICSSFIAIDSNGKIYPSCDAYLAEQRGYRIGDIGSLNLVKLLNSETRIRFSELSNFKAPQCEKCEWFNGCYNGCTFQRDTTNIYSYCEGRKKLFSFIREEIKNIN